MNEAEIEQLSKSVQSGHLNFLLGAGASTPFMPLLGDIEQRLNEALNDDEREPIYKEYFSKVMLPNKRLVLGSLLGDEKNKCDETLNCYSRFLADVTGTVLRRQSSILSKQVNLFTTNVDLMIECSLEKLQLDYNDGFCGRISPAFGLGNYKKTVHRRSLHYDHVTEIPVFNLIKIHGSTTWARSNNGQEAISYSHGLMHLKDDLESLGGETFRKAYDQILVVNPQIGKHLETVLNFYYSELLRFYGSELEKENALLFVLGFSMEDRHIREITLRAAKSNPTLHVHIFCAEAEYDEMLIKMDAQNLKNISAWKPVNGSAFYTLDSFTSNILNKVKCAEV